MLSLFKIVSDPQILIAGIFIAVLGQAIHKRIRVRFAFLFVNRELSFLLVICLLLAPVYYKNSTFFTISPDSQGLLRSPAGSTTYRPPLLWGVYRLFASQEEIDEFFKSQPTPGDKMNYPEILQGSNFIMICYLISLVIVLWVFYKYLNIDARLLVMAVLLQTSGPLFYLSDYFYIPSGLVPVYKFLFYFLLSQLFLSELSKLLPQIGNRNRDYLKSFTVLCSGSLVLLVSSRSSLMVDEINQVMTETLTITLINLTLALCAVLLTSKSKHWLRLIAGALGLITGLLVIIKLSTILTPLVIMFLILILKHPSKEKIRISAFFLIMALIPSVSTAVSGSNSETSQTWYGLVAYAIEFQSESPLDLKLSKNSQELLDSALNKRAETWKKYPEIVQEYDFTYQKAGISLYHGALPAAQELGFNNISPTYTAGLFKEISLSSFYSHKDLAVRALAENLKAPIGLFKLDDKYMSMSKIIKNPLTYLFFFIIFMRYLPKRTFAGISVVLLIFALSLINYVVVSIFNGPIPRYFYIYDPLLLYSMIVMLSRCLVDQREVMK